MVGSGGSVGSGVSVGTVAGLMQASARMDINRARHRVGFGLVLDIEFSVRVAVQTV